MATCEGIQFGGSNLLQKFASTKHILNFGAGSDEIFLDFMLDVTVKSVDLLTWRLQSLPLLQAHGMSAMSTLRPPTPLPSYIQPFLIPPPSFLTPFLLSPASPSDLTPTKTSTPGTPGTPYTSTPYTPDTTYTSTPDTTPATDTINNIESAISRLGQEIECLTRSCSTSDQDIVRKFATKRKLGLSMVHGREGLPKRDKTPRTNCRYKRYPEEMLKHAMFSVQMGYKTVNQAAKEYHIPRQTLQYRLFKHKRKHQYHTFSPSVIPHSSTTSSVFLDSTDNSSKPCDQDDVIKSEVTSPPPPATSSNHGNCMSEIRRTLSDTVLKGMMTSNGTATPTPLSSLGLKCLSSLILSDPNLLSSSNSEGRHSPLPALVKCGPEPDTGSHLPGSHLPGSHLPGSHLPDTSTSSSEHPTNANPSIKDIISSITEKANRME